MTGIKSYGAQYAYRHKTTGEFVSYEPYHAKGPATRGLRIRVKHGLARPEGATAWPDKKTILAHIEENYELVTFAVVPLSEYQSLWDDQKWRSCLEAGGVDNWSYYSDSLREGGYYGDEEGEE